MRRMHKPMVDPKTVETGARQGPQRGADPG